MGLHNVEVMRAEKLSRRKVVLKCLNACKLLFSSHCSSVGRVVILWAGQSRNCGSIPDKGMRSFLKASMPVVVPSQPRIQ
jgi:hypothetical protein